MAQSVLSFVSLAVLAGCGATASEPCTQADLARIEADYHAQLAKACFGQGLNCTERPRVDAEYHARRAAWVRCKGE